MQISRRMFTTAMLSSAAGFGAAKDYIVYIGTYTGPKSKGIYAWRSTGGKLAPLGAVGETPNPSFLALNTAGTHLFAANEIANYNGEKAGSVTAFTVDKSSGKLTALNTVSSKGGGPCYVSVDKTQKNVLVANYGGGSVAVLPIKADGNLQEASAFDQHTGSGATPRQRGPHAHCVKLSPDNKFALVTDLGLDQLIVYRFDADKGSLTANDPPFGKLAGGSGPRHFAFHPRQSRVYVINELASTVTAFDWNGGNGTLSEIQTVSTLPAGFKGDTTTAEIVIHPNGRFLYGSNRGHDSLSVFGIGSDGKLTLIDHTPTKGQVPRNFALDPTGTMLFAANQKSDNVVLFRVDGKTGKLTETGEVLEVASPVCVRFLPV